jgi:uncharacterized membrane protein YgcG
LFWKNFCTEEDIMVAMPVFRSRVAPVLNWCSKMLIFHEDQTDQALREEIMMLETTAFERLRLLQKKGVQTLICGALSLELLHYGESLGLNIIYGVSGDIQKVFQAYRTDQLDQPCFWLPGCRCQRRYRSSWMDQGSNVMSLEERNQTMPGGRGQGKGKCAGTGGGGSQGRGGGAGKGGNMGIGAGGFCVCSQCGTKVPHEQGIPCTQVKCSQCGAPMVRES